MQDAQNTICAQGLCNLQMFGKPIIDCKLAHLDISHIRVHSVMHQDRPEYAYMRPEFACMLVLTDLSRMWRFCRSQTKHYGVESVQLLFEEPESAYTFGYSGDIPVCFSRILTSCLWISCSPSSQSWRDAKEMGKIWRDPEEIWMQIGFSVRYPMYSPYDAQATLKQVNTCSQCT